eukprot:1908478-Rhodomonas_salina.1
MFRARFAQNSLLAIAALLAVNVSTAAEVGVSVMTWNCMQFPETFNVFDWDQEARADRMATAIRALDPSPDVIGFQEVLNDKAIDAIASLKDLYPHQTDVLGASCTGLDGVWNRIVGNCQKLDFDQIVSSGVMMISKHPFSSVNVAYFDNHAGLTADSIAAKGVIYAEIAVDSAYRVHVVNTHLQSDAEVWQDAATDDTHAIRMSQLQEIKEYLDEFSIPATEPVMIMGDLNVRKDNTANYNAMLTAGGSTTDNLNDPGTGTVSCQSNWASNWFKAKYDGDDFTCDAGYVLDYILLRTDHLQPVNTTQSQVVPMTFSPKIEWGGSDKLERDDGMYGDLSDHYAVQQTFTFELEEQEYTGAAASATVPWFWTVCLFTVSFVAMVSGECPKD